MRHCRSPFQISSLLMHLLFILGDPQKCTRVFANFCTHFEFGTRVRADPPGPLGSASFGHPCNFHMKNYAPSQLKDPLLTTRGIIDASI